MIQSKAQGHINRGLAVRWIETTYLLGWSTVIDHVAIILTDRKEPKKSLFVTGYSKSRSISAEEAVRRIETKLMAVVTTQRTAQDVSEVVLQVRTRSRGGW